MRRLEDAQKIVAKVIDGRIAIRSTMSSRFAARKLAEEIVRELLISGYEISLRAAEESASQEGSEPS